MAVVTETFTLEAGCGLCPPACENRELWDRLPERLTMTVRIPCLGIDQAIPLVRMSPVAAFDNGGTQFYQIDPAAPGWAPDPTYDGPPNDFFRHWPLGEFAHPFYYEPTTAARVPYLLTLCVAPRKSGLAVAAVKVGRENGVIQGYGFQTGIPLQARMPQCYVAVECYLMVTTLAGRVMPDGSLGQHYYGPFGATAQFVLGVRDDATGFFGGARQSASTDPFAGIDPCAGKPVTQFHDSPWAGAPPLCPPGTLPTYYCWNMSTPDRVSTHYVVEGRSKIVAYLAHTNYPPIGVDCFGLPPIVSVIDTLNLPGAVGLLLVRGEVGEVVITE